MAYLMTFFKAYILLLPLLYFVLMVIIGILIFLFKNKNEINGCKGFFVCLLNGCLYSVAYALVSFGCSAFEGLRDEDGKAIAEQPFYRYKFPMRKLLQLYQNNSFSFENASEVKL